MTNRWKTPVSALTALILAACGGGGSVTSAGDTPTGISGVVVDGYLEGVTVFLDLNNNAVHDSGEPISKPTTGDGAYTLDTTGISQARLAQAYLVAMVPDTAKDADFPGQTLAQRGKQGYTLLAPAEAYVDAAAAKTATVADAILSPLTTLVASEMMTGGAPLDQALARVEERLQLQGRGLMKDFVASGDKGMHAVAQVTATALGELGREVSTATAEANTKPLAQEKLRTVLEVASQQVPALIRTLGVAPKPQTPVASASDASEQANASPASSSTAAAAETSSATVNVTAPTAAEIMTRVEEELKKNQSAVKSSVGASLSKKSRYIVVFKRTVDDPDAESNTITRGVGNSKREFLYRNALKGFAVSLPEAAAEQFLEAMAKNPNVDYVETDREISLSATSTSLVTQNSATWGLDRIDQRDLPLSTSYTYDTTGAGVKAYVIDTGIQTSHSDFSGRVMTGYSAIADGNGTNDCNGHGTHVAGTIGGARWGVAKGTTLVPVRVLDCAGSGSTSGVIAGIDWVASNASGPSVINMSLGGGAYQPLDDALAGAVAKGITVVVAAGNSNVDACTASPARAPAAITVGATTNSDARASYSNWGGCLDLFAPGSSITSSWLNNGMNTISGTSMASPHVAGAVARLLEAQPTLKPADVEARIKANATQNKVISGGVGSPNLLLMAANSGGTVTDPTTPPQEPTVTVVSVKGLVSTTANLKTGWQVRVTIAIKDAAGNAVQGAVASGSFSAGGSAVSCTTASNGTCAVSTGTLSKKVSATTFGITALSGTGMRYDAAQNAASSLTVHKP